MVAIVIVRIDLPEGAYELIQSRKVKPVSCYTLGDGKKASVGEHDGSVPAPVITPFALEPGLASLRDLN